VLRPPLVGHGWIAGAGCCNKCRGSLRQPAVIKTLAISGGGVLTLLERASAVPASLAARRLTVAAPIRAWRRRCRKGGYPDGKPQGGDRGAGDGILIS
jgi:hypothetical protein